MRRAPGYWLPAQRLYELRRAAGRHAQKPKYPGRIVSVRRRELEGLVAKVPQLDPRQMSLPLPTTRPPCTDPCCSE